MQVNQENTNAYVAFWQTLRFSWCPYYLDQNVVSRPGQPHILEKHRKDPMYYRASLVSGWVNTDRETANYTQVQNYEQRRSFCEIRFRFCLCIDTSRGYYSQIVKFMDTKYLTKSCILLIDPLLAWSAKFCSIHIIIKIIFKLGKSAHFTKIPVWLWTFDPHTHAYTHTRAHAYKHTHTCARVCVCVCVRAVRVFVCFLCACMCAIHSVKTKSRRHPIWFRTTYPIGIESDNKVTILGLQLSTQSISSWNIGLHILSPTTFTRVLPPRHPQIQYSTFSPS